MIFYIARIVAEVMAPFPVIVIFSLISLLCLISRRTAPGIGFLSCALFFQIFFGYGIFVKQYVTDRESLYPALQEDRIDQLKGHPVRYIVVLGSGHVSDDRLPANSQIGGSSMYRLVEGIRLRRYWPEAKLVLTGGVGYDPVANAVVVRDVAEMLGVRRDEMIVEERPRDTGQEAQLLAPLLGDQTFLLVTSALHMPRAVAIFRQHGMNPLPAPTDFIMKREKAPAAGSFMPNPGNMELSRRMIYELLAEQWMALRGLMQKTAAKEPAG